MKKLSGKVMKSRRLVASSPKATRLIQAGVRNNRTVLEVIADLEQLNPHYGLAEDDGDINAVAIEVTAHPQADLLNYGNN